LARGWGWDIIQPGIAGRGSDEIQTGEEIAGTQKAAPGGRRHTGMKHYVTFLGLTLSQPSCSPTFSAPGKVVLSRVAGTPINTVDDLAAQLRSGSLKPGRVPVDYVVVQGQKVILNTRASTALNRAGIPKSQWYGRNVTGVKVPGMPGTTFDDLCNMQTEKNLLPATGTPNIPQ
jgi:hypothetical protein